MSQESKKNIGQLRKLDFDLANYFSNTIIPQLFVDADMILRIFTPPAMEQFSLSYDDVGKNISHVQENIRYPTIVENIQEVITRSEILEKEIQTTDGNWFQMNIIPYVEHERNLVNGVIITFVDITKRLATIKELEKMNAEHTVLMFALSHDMKQPISTLKLLSEALLKTFKSGDSEKFHLMIERLQSTSNGLNKMLDEFTATGEANLKEEQDNTQNIKSLCANVLDALKEEIEGKDICILKEFETLKVNFPRNNLRSIIYNLLHNAIKYRNPERASVIQISTTQNKDYVIFTVEDNGFGIAEDHLETIFEKSSRIRTEIEGTGMGLYIIKRMIEAQDGKIELESTLGKSSKFLVYFKKKDN